MKIVEAPEKYFKQEDDVICFLAGGISNCEDWQAKVIEVLGKYENTDNLVIMNPRRTNFDINNPGSAEEQIKWEFNWLNQMDIFSMFFANSDSVQPICMYELGRHLVQMPHRFLDDWKDRIVIGIEHGYSRTQDVKIQTALATGHYMANTYFDINEYARDIYIAYRKINATK